MKIIEWKALIEVLIENAPIIVFALWILLQFSTRFNFLKNYKEIKAYRFVAPKDEPGGEITIFYGTNRNKTQDSRLNNIYGSDLSTLQLGSCTISIPEGHKIGEIERPRKILLWSRREDVNKDIVLTSIFEDNEKDFYNWLKKNAANTENKSALVFVHGFNTSFVEAAWRTGQIAYDLPFNGVTGFFSWPSTGDTIDYGRDIERADSSITNLVTFIKDIIQKTDVEQLHFVAHSMGNRVLTRALNVLVGDPSFSDKINRISQIILAAPDIDKDVFDREIFPVFKAIGTRRTLYTSDKDKALKLAEKLRTGLCRIGLAGENIYLTEGLDTIDASNVMSEGNNHSYMFETDELLTDIHLLVTQGLDPASRRLREVTKSNFKYWLFRQ